MAVAWVTNKTFAFIFKVPANPESVFISSLILCLIITPGNSYQGLIFLGGAGFLAMASKFICAINKKHIFNPAAFAVVMTALMLNKQASWWVGNSLMMPVVLLGGLLVVRKIKRFKVVASFFIVSLLFILGFSFFKGNDLTIVVKATIFDSPMIFFALVMLTEPLTTPPTKVLQIIYGGIVGLGYFYFTPEVSLVLGNIFSYLVSPKERLILTLHQKIQLSRDSYEFIFEQKEKKTPLKFEPGQYMEWTLHHKNPDSRGLRRYFTIAASPLEPNLRIGVKISPNSSSFKKSLLHFRPGSEIVASELAGEFILPKDPSKKLCFIAGGIGVTPYRSIIKYLIDTDQKRDIILLYSNKKAEDIVYKDIFDTAFKKIGLKTVYLLTDKTSIPKGWNGKVGYIDAKVIQEEIPDYKDRIFYISGPHSMVDIFERTLKGMDLSGVQIKVDYFPGYA